MRLWWWFRSPHVHCFSVTPAPVNVPGGSPPPPGNPAPGQENRRFAVPSAYSLRLSGRAPACILAGYALSAHPCASPRPAVNASAIFSRTEASLRVLNTPLPPLSLRARSVPSPLRGRVRGNRTHRYENFARRYPVLNQGHCCIYPQ